MEPKVTSKSNLHVGLLPRGRAALTHLGIPALSALALGRPSLATAAAMGAVFSVSLVLIAIAHWALLTHYRLPHEARSLRAAGSMGAFFSVVGAGMGVCMGLLPTPAVLAILPAAGLSAGLTLFPPSPRSLRTVGWASAATTLCLGVMLAS